MRKYLDAEINSLNNQLIEMGSLVEKAIKNTVGMIVNGNTDGLETAREQEEQINSSEKAIQDHCIKLLLHQAPVAHDLRTISAALKMITDLERIGDQAIDIAEMAVYLDNKENIYSMTHISDMAKGASKMVTMAVDAFVKKDILLAKEVSMKDDVIDSLFVKVKNELVEIIYENKEFGTQALDIVMIAKYLERIGDHAVNIAEWVAFSITGSCEFK